ncbi:MAG TPA: FKBP-type peptidyl-prolyl cis-trans isomerase [Solirubrobacterales bacterium]
MKFLALIVVICSGIALAACGDGGSTAATTQATQASTTEQEQEPEPATKKPQEQEPAPKKQPAGTNASQPIAGVSPRPPKVSVPSGPPPTELVVEDLKIGKGPVTRPFSRLAVHFVAVDYKSGKVFETRWDKQPFVFEYNHGLPMQGWEEGLKGMRVGGRRKMLVPSHLAYKEGSIVYVVDLLAVEQRPDFGKRRAPG